MDLRELLAAVDQIDTIIPSIDKVASEVHKLGPPLKAALEPVMLGLAEMRVTLFEYYVRRGMTRDEALALTVAGIAETNKAFAQKRG